MKQTAWVDGQAGPEDRKGFLEEMQKNLVFLIIFFWALNLSEG